jgi:hypothetical protein
MAAVAELRASAAEIRSTLEAMIEQRLKSQDLNLRCVEGGSDDHRR